MPQHLQPIVQALQSNGPVNSVADSLIGLKEAREEADYDHPRPFDERETLALLKDARATVRSLQAAGPSLDQAMALIALPELPRGAIVLEASAVGDPAAYWAR